MSIFIEIILGEPFVEVNGRWWALIVLIQELLQENKRFSLVKVATSIIIILIPDLIDFLSNGFIKFISYEFFEESCHFLS
jgi:hypothetical protein